MTNSNDRMTAARRNAENQLNRAQKRQDNLKSEQEKEKEALKEKMARLRELGGAKGGPNKGTPTTKPAREPKPAASRAASR
jgi:hypothetical protein